MPNLDQPQVTVSRDAGGVWTDLSGRVEIFTWPGTPKVATHPGRPDWCLFIDGHPAGRFPTRTAAQQAAWQHRHNEEQQAIRQVVDKVLAGHPDPAPNRADILQAVA